MESADSHIYNITNSVKGDVSGVVRIRAGEFIGGVFIQNIFADIIRSYPKLTVELTVHSTLEDAPVQNTDIGIRMMRPQLGYATSKHIGNLAYGVFAHKSYVARFGIPRGISDLSNHRFIGYNKLDFDRLVMKSLGVNLPNECFALRSDSEFAQLGAIGAGMGIGPCCVKFAESNPDLVPIMPEILRSDREMWVYVANSLRAGGPVSIVFDELVKRLGERIGG